MPPLLQPSHHAVYPTISPTSAALKSSTAGKTVLVTGAGTGIGRAIALSFAEAGASAVIVAARRAAPLQETAALVAAAAPLCAVHVRGDTDITSEADVQALFAGLPAVPDVVVSNAAASRSEAPVAQTDAGLWWGDLDTNLRGSFLVARAFARAAPEGKHAVLVNVSSNAAWRYVPGRSAYSASKAALNVLTEYVHREGGGHLTAVAMHPGGVADSDMARAANLPDNIRAMLVDEPGLAGGTAVWLASPAAAWLGGRFVSATWDMDELLALKDKVLAGDLLTTRIAGLEG